MQLQKGNSHKTFQIESTISKTYIEMTQ